MSAAQVSFWGKIRAIERDYFICQGIVDENGKVAPFDTERATFKSTDGCVWTPLVSVDAAMAAKCEEINLSLIHISEPTRLLSISYAVFCLKKKKKKNNKIS
eukprot:TRINITY_DN10526_c0_g1_i7.p2 TRINITY_DN10526_c0_g1~~TRINITY_DN10526_c0_g1_i7.p2  ORF type:complete len:102 (-),score=29.70 TRINITY_DN10526_c0_g1_i7:83-388(-)